MNLLWLLRAARWLRVPPSAARLRLILMVLLLCLALVAIERIWGWPAWLTLPHGTRRLPRI